MRQIYLFLMISLLLAGCHAPAGEPITDVNPSTTEVSAPTVLPETQPPAKPADPMQMLLAAMTTEEKVGQLFLARCPVENGINDISQYGLGGYLFFGEDFEGETPDSLRQMIAGYQMAAPIPLLMAVDEEGGTVCRISKFPAFRSSRFLSSRSYYAAGGLEAVLTAESEKSSFLKDLGLNVNMGPVCDITTDPESFMYQRSLGQSPEETGRFVSSTVQIMENNKIGSVLKHFPGYGNNADTHTGIAHDKRPLEDLEETDLIPFSAGIRAGCDAILVSHTIVSALDDQYPASLSPAVHNYLRNDMGFHGVIVTDDLVMEAITDAYGPEESAVLAVLAGNDLLCSTEYSIQYPAVLEAVRSGRISMAQLEESVLRVLKWKQDLGLIF